MAILLDFLRLLLLFCENKYKYYLISILPMICNFLFNIFDKNFDFEGNESIFFKYWKPNYKNYTLTIWTIVT